MTSPTSSFHTAFLAALSDELTKIAEVQETTGQKVKKWAKNTALLAGGYAAGHGSAMVGDHVLQKVFGERWKQMATQEKMKLVAPLMGLAGVGMTVAGMNLAKQVHEGSTKKNE